jgi:hypothetical protein
MRRGRSFQKNERPPRLASTVEEKRIFSIAIIDSLARKMVFLAHNTAFMLDMYDAGTETVQPSGNLATRLSGCSRNALEF